MKLFVFDHCPFCVKAMMPVGLKNLQVEIEAIQNHDVQARIDKVGANMVPILQKEDGSFMAESLDIVKYLDKSDNQPVLTPATQANQINNWLSQASQVSHILVFPRWLKIELPEFQSQQAKNWFEKNKTKMIDMSFEKAFEQSNLAIEQMHAVLQKLDFIQLPSDKNNQLSFDDINLFPFLRNLTVVKDLKLPNKAEEYVTQVSKLTKVHLYKDQAI
ncbi:glutaredoxin 2 [Catenovulum sp. 2E275]|uniref:glutaredoxin 2 n=1 Tax=Catenovulum sp. 2E275 TaxID=2980497 RepID=UPI0021D36D8E|nr:glutaredoxin 2 [Catenovulum sp. 2E275]MCU4675712.1 glutaredoxin 2 [Catenovulum sp. 2E275]